MILDEVQRAPELFSYLQGFVDARRGGPFVLRLSSRTLALPRAPRCQVQPQDRLFFYTITGIMHT